LTRAYFERALATMRARETKNWAAHEASWSVGGQSCVRARRGL